MTHLGRLLAVAFVLLGTFATGPAAKATHCPPEHYQHPPAVPDDYPCPGSPAPGTPKPSPKPSVQPTPAPTAAPTAAPTRRPSAPVRQSTPAPTVIDNVEVPTVAPNATPEIIVDGPIAEDEPLDVAEPSASASSWIFGFIVGLVIGGFAGRASWGLRRRRRQQIFG
ncbi:MAG TPA: hypothetical protein VFA34_04440 [Actinomycetota bacterium]|jgi:hypothetical protein|nr:hypothetical protein [Actinomycetota bacterium]